MAHLYKNNKGFEVNGWSYSAGSTFRFCRQRFKLQKIDGWKERGDSAAAKFGITFESAVQYFHTNSCKPESGQDEWCRLWLKWKDAPLKYKKDDTWAEYYDAGKQLVALYELMQPTLPIRNPAFQLNYKRTVFPGTELEDIFDQGYVDMLSRAPWDHPMLPPATAPADSSYRPLIIDIKTSAAGLDVPPNMLGLDPQLARYASLSGVPDVAFLWAQHTKPKSFQKGTEVTFLQESGKWKSLDWAVVVKYDDETETVCVASPSEYEALNRALSEVKGRGSAERKDQLLIASASSVPVERVTKQSLRFMATRISPENIREAGQIAAKQIVEVIDSSKNNYWPKDGAGVRFPDNRCPWCPVRGICLGDARLTEELLVQITPAAKEEDWLAELETDE